MQKKICLITGANSGIGKASAIQIAEKGYHVIIACRNLSKGQAALQEIKEKSKSDAIEFMHVDMSLQSSVKALMKCDMMCHCEQSEAISSGDLDSLPVRRDCFAALAMTCTVYTTHLGLL